MGGYWFITNRERSTYIENSIYYNKWSWNTPRAGEAIIVVELVITTCWKIKTASSGYIIVHNDDNKLIQMINNKLSPTQHAQEAAAEVALIK